MRDQVGERPGFAEDYETEKLKARGVAPPVPDSEIQDRIARLRELMARDGFSAVLVYGAPDEPSWIRYLANYVHPFVIAESFLLVAPEGDPILFTDREWVLTPDTRDGPFLGRTGHPIRRVPVAIPPTRRGTGDGAARPQRRERHAWHL